MIFNVDNVSFFWNFCHFIRTGSMYWVSATKEQLVGHKKGVFDRSWDQLNDSYVALTNKHQKMAIKAKKDIVKMENHCTKKIRLGYLESNIWRVDSPYWSGSWGYIFQYTPSSTGCLLEIILPALLGLYFPVHSQTRWTFTGKYYLVNWAILNSKISII